MGLELKRNRRMVNNIFEMLRMCLGKIYALLVGTVTRFSLLQGTSVFSIKNFTGT